MAADATLLELRKRNEGRLSGLRTNRYSWWVHWKELAMYKLPRRYKWLITPNEASRGSYINQAIIDNTATIAARTLYSGLNAGLTNPMTPWFKFKIDGYEDESSNVVRWLAECAKRMQRVFQESNFYNSISVLYADLVVFGTAVMLIYEDFDNVICCYNPALGEFYIDVSPKLEGSVFYREFVRTVEQIVVEFGIENVTADVAKAYKEGGASWTREHVIAHSLEANTPLGDKPSPVPTLFKFRECYWLQGKGRGDDATFLRVKGYHDFPGIIARWDVVGNDPYGRSPGMDALGDTKQLQLEQKRKAQAIDKMVNPPMLADISMKNQPASGLPGGVTYIPGLGRERPGFAPAYTVMPPIAEMKQDIQEVQTRIKDTYFNRLFTDISDLKTVRSATEIEARREEKLLMLPVIKRLDKEVLAPAIERTWGVMMRANLLPKPIPPEVVGHLIGIKYISPFAMAMLAAETTAIERAYAFGGNLAAVKPEIMDNYDTDSTVHIYVDALGADPRILHTDEERDAAREAKAQQAQAAQTAQLGMAGVTGAKTLSETDVGGGKNALESMLGNAA
jgi:hypothetical protein